MEHPKDRAGLTRRQLLHGAAGSALGSAPLDSSPAARTRRRRSAPRRRAGGPASKLVVPKPVRARAACRCRAPTTRSPGRSRPTTSRSPTDAPTESGPLRVYNYADYLDPATVKKFEKQYRTQGPDRHLQLGRRGDREARGRRRRVRRDHRPDRREHRQPDRPAAPAAAQPLLPAEPRARTSGRSCRTRSTTAAAATRCPTSSGSDGIGWRNDKVKADIAAMDVPWDIFWHSQAVPGQGRRSSTTSATRSRMPMQRDAMRTGARPDLNTEDQALDRAGRRATLAQLNGICNVKVTITDYQTLPEAKTVAPPLLVGRPPRAPRSTTCRRASSPTCSRSGARTRTASSRTTSSASAGRRRTPRSPTGSSNFMLDEKNAYANFVNFVGYTPPQNAIDAELLIKQRPDPEEPHERRRPPRPVRGQPGAAAAERRGRALLGRGLVEVQGRLSDGVALDLAAARAPRASSGSRSSSSSRSTPSSASRSATRTRSPSRCRSGTRSTGTSATCSRSLANIWHGEPVPDRLRCARSCSSRSRSASRSLIGYPVAYFAARHGGRWKGLVLLLLILPFWINYLMRMLAWINLLSPDGWATRVLHDLGIERLFICARPALRARRLARRPAAPR